MGCCGCYKRARGYISEKEALSAFWDQRKGEFDFPSKSEQERLIRDFQQTRDSSKTNKTRLDSD